jgi:tetratricopeptide (TPR) repeat protein
MTPGPAPGDRNAPAAQPDWLAKGLMARREGRRDAALHAFRQAALAWPTDERPLVEQAEEALALGDPEAARTLLTTAAGVAPASPWPHERLGELAMLARRPLEAHGHFSDAAALAPQSLRAPLGQAEALASMGRDGEAAATLASAEAALGPRPEFTNQALALLHDRGRWPEARTVAGPTPWHAWARLELRCTPPEAWPAILAAAPDEATAQALHATAAEAAGDLATAATAAGAALALHPEQHAARAVPTPLALLAGQREAARADIQLLATRDAAMNRLQGRLASPGLSFLGAVLAEFELDRALLAELAALPDTPAALLPLAARHPDSTLVALRLWGALRRAGLPKVSGPPVPARLGQYWDDAAPPATVALMASWGAADPGLAVTRFDDIAARAYLADSHPPPVLRAWRRCRDPRSRADLLRLAWLS